MKMKNQVWVRPQARTQVVFANLIKSKAFGNQKHGFCIFLKRLHASTRIRTEDLVVSTVAQKSKISGVLGQKRPTHNSHMLHR